jgi:hypothetical protein
MRSAGIRQSFGDRRRVDFAMPIVAPCRVFQSAISVCHGTFVKQYFQALHVNNTGDISWHKNRIFISEVFRFEELGFELITPGYYRVFFRDMEIGELNAEELRFRSVRRMV